MENTRPAPLDGMPTVIDQAEADAAPHWRVELEIEGQLWWPTWIGPARDALDASRQADAWFYGQFIGERAVREAYPLRVRSVLQLPQEARRA